MQIRPLLDSYTNGMRSGVFRVTQLGFDPIVMSLFVVLATFDAWIRLEGGESVSKIVSDTDTTSTRILGVSGISLFKKWN